MGSLIPDVGNVSINTTGALNNLMKAYDNFGVAISFTRRSYYKTCR